MKGISSCVARGLNSVDQIGSWIGLLGIRLLLAYEFGVAGLEKWRGDNWFADIQGDFPFPFSAVPADISWLLATWTELIGAAALVIGLGTRFWAASLLILDIVAWTSVHGANGYNVCDNGFKLPLMYLVMLLPLVLADRADCRSTTGCAAVSSGTTGPRSHRFPIRLTAASRHFLPSH